MSAIVRVQQKPCEGVRVVACAVARIYEAWIDKQQLSSTGNTTMTILVIFFVYFLHNPPRLGNIRLSFA